ncbi:amino acid ABC transporter substrate-binding protein [Desulfomonile tiedjei]|uniref:Amino acid/amide ABC transporter substrate-binding protein, HAAT family n=1 Tax=Desulfomonile tiedjei (strain ATCC 49306 / DSM 6799 / DCB-1) TaxID=706587 RepID=I4C1V0_DESTA|nr:amino acid ABC transporter substrate-binding protein [Desulfomonile tiedjei]AFM23541.1 amino acid/amide ABC transporter substrate-binding protein, HAAT family [Desulfomonile tiedjei DSM 6799]
MNILRRLTLRLSAPLLVLAALLRLWACPVWAVDPVRIGVSFALSGDYAPLGGMCADGLRLWAKTQNGEGGILGRPIDLVIHDDQGDPETAATIYREMLSSGQFDFVFGPYSSPISKAVIPLLEEYRYPTLLPVTSVESVWDSGPKYAFGVTTPERRWTKAIFTLMAESNVTRLVILVNDALMQLGSPRDAEKWARRFGLEVVSLETASMPDIGEQLRRARDSGVHAILVWGYFHDAVAIRKALASIGWTPRIFFAQMGPALDEYCKVLGDLADYSLGCCIWDPKIGSSFPGGSEFLNSFRREYKRDPSYHAANCYAAGVILAEAISRAGCMDREKVREVLSNLDTVTLIGRYGVDEAGVQVRQRPIIVQWQNGRKRIVWPETLRTAPLLFPPETKP